MIIFLLTNDTEFNDEPFLDILTQELECHQKVGILSPCAKNWAEKDIIKKMEQNIFGIYKTHVICSDVVI